MKSSAKKAPRRRAAPTPDKKLAGYRAKRDFEGTPEPGPDGEGGAARDRFVVQEHSATRLHWDLRLERDGVAVSWAIPNGIPELPGENRKAVHTEDHPLEYLTWEGVIPKGNYGAGTMKVWDSGTYDSHEWTDSKATVTFHGERVRGRYHLFQAGRDEKDWMIRRVDPPLDPDRRPMPEHVVPLVAVPGTLPADDDAYVYEVAWHGTRAIAFCEPARLRLEDGAGGDVTALYPELSRLVRDIGAHSAILDGELVALDAGGRPDPSRLERRAQPASENTARRRARDAPIVYEIYDLLYLDGHPLDALPWRERRERLESLELAGANWRLSQYHEGDGAALLEAARQNGLPGIVAKPIDSAYRLGAGWIEISTTDDGGARVELTHPDRVMYPSAGFTKADMADYYRAVAPVVLPHLAGRPLSMRRYFRGVDGPKRWEKECPPQAPDWLTRVAVPSEAKGRPISYCVVDSEEALMWSVNHANIELHVTLALGDDIQRPTTMVFDLDPGPPADIGDCAEVALLLRGMFEQLGLESFAKTTGSKGIQVYVPLNSGATYEQTKPFARQVAELLAERWPERVTATMAKRERHGKVFVDWSQNDWHKSTVCVYSL
ncbi:MAG: non-homologous end-joining DNA ligase, partial [Thermoleophilaceae bacterium]